MNEKMAVWSFFWSGADSKSTLGAGSQWFPRLVLTPSQAQVLTPRSNPFIFLLVQFCFGCLASVLVSEQTPIHLKQSQVNPEPDKKKIHRIFSTTRNPATTPPSKSVHDISAKPHQKTISQYPHVSSHQKVTRQPKPFDPTTNKPHLSILATVEAPHQLLEKPATTTHKS